MIKTAVVGATGYTGQELVRILARHPETSITALTSRKEAGKPYGQVFPAFKDIVDLKITTHDVEKVCEKADIVFLALPHAESQAAVATVIEKKKKAIDLSADFRFKKLAPYRRWYGEHRFPALLRKAVYGMPEIYRNRIKKADLVANPGCYPTSVILALKPLAEKRLFDPKSVIVDSKSGVSGAGKSLVQSLMYCEANENLRPYNIYIHRHTPEMEQELSALFGKKVQVTFAPHLVPLNRGILSTIYLKLMRKNSAEKIHDIYQKAYNKEPFVRLLPPGQLPELARVKDSNFCDIGLALAPSGKELVVVAAIDNLMKGASGTAVQNMNIMAGIEETTGINAIPITP